MYDIKTDTWHYLVDRVAGIVDPGDGFCWLMFAGDGGLVCVVSPPKDAEERPLLITVCNPLTRQHVKLPSHDLCSVRPRMVQLVMDRERKCYKVIVVDNKKLCGGTGSVAQIFNSQTRSWSSALASADLIFGDKYEWILDDNGEFLQEIHLGPCAYDCAIGQLLELEGPNQPWKEAYVKSYALVKDRLFVLHEERYTHEDQRYCISEYQGQKGIPSWVKLKVHRCKEFEKPPHSVTYTLHLKACKGFLLVFADNGETNAFRHELTVHGFTSCLRVSGKQSCPLLH